MTISLCKPFPRLDSALEALSGHHPNVKLRPLSEATPQSRMKARKYEGKVLSFDTLICSLSTFLTYGKIVVLDLIFDYSFVSQNHFVPRSANAEQAQTSYERSARTSPGRIASGQASPDIR